jgi:hypothetical protein
MRRRGWLATTVAVFLTGCFGCGSTVVTSGNASTAGLGGSSIGAAGAGSSPGSTNQTPGSGQPAVNVGGGPSTAVGQLGTSSSTIGGSGAGGPRSNATQSQTGLSLGTSKPLLIGFRYVKDASPFISSLGLKEVSTGDQQGFAAAVAAYINAHGGVAGRPLRVLYVGETAEDAAAQPQTTQAASCATMTQDNHVFAAVSPSFSGTSFQACMQKAGVPYVEDNWNYWDPTNPATNRSYFVPSYPDAARSQPVLVSALLRHGWFGSKPVIGVAAYSYQDRDRAVAALQSVLSADGLPARITYRVSSPNDYQNAVLRFKALGVNRVLYIEGSGGIETLLFMNAAESQNYYPVYGLDSRSGANLLQTNAPAAQLRGAFGIGWMPTVDLGVKGFTAPDAACLSIIHKAGLATADNTAARFALATCDVFFFFKTVMQARTPAPGSATAFTAAAESLGSRYTPTGSFRAWFGPDRHDGTSAVRPLGYVGDCSCFRYQGGLFATG